MGLGAGSAASLSSGKTIKRRPASRPTGPVPRPIPRRAFRSPIGGCRANGVSAAAAAGGEVFRGVIGYGVVDRAGAPPAGAPPAGAPPAAGAVATAAAPPHITLFLYLERRRVLLDRFLDRLADPFLVLRLVI
jgi:hypothetical protein